MKNAFGGLLNEHRHWTHPVIHETLVDLLMIQKKIHKGVFAVMDGTFAGDGPGPRCMIPHVKNVLLAGRSGRDRRGRGETYGFRSPPGSEICPAWHELGLGCGDPREIEIVGDVDAASENWNLEGSLQENDLRLTEPAPDLLGTPQEASRVVVENVACAMGLCCQRGLPRRFLVQQVRAEAIEDSLQSEWGRLFANWGQVRTDAEGRGYPDVGAASGSWSAAA